MAVTFINKPKAQQDPLQPTAKGTVPLKRKEAIKGARQFTIIVTSERKVALKLLGVQQGKTVMSLLAEVLTLFVASLPEVIAKTASPHPGERIGFKVEPALWEAVRKLADDREVSVQALIATALDEYFLKAGKGSIKIAT